MIRHLERSHDRIVGYSLADDVTEEECVQIVSELRDAVAEHGRIRLLLRLSDISLSSFLNALDEQFRFVKEHRDDIERVAIVTDDTATEVLAKIAEAIRPVEARTFALDDEPEAWAWLG